MSKYSDGASAGQEHTRWYTVPLFFPVPYIVSPCHFVSVDFSLFFSLSMYVYVYKYSCIVFIKTNTYTAEYVNDNV